MRERLTFKSPDGTWGLNNGYDIKKVPSELYGAICKLKDYEETGIQLNEIELVKELQIAAVQKADKFEWTNADIHPLGYDYILLSFENFSIPEIGRYEEDAEGNGAYYIGDEDESCLSQDMIVNAWMPLPEPYRRDEEIEPEQQEKTIPKDFYEKRFNRID